MKTFKSFKQGVINDIITAVVEGMHEANSFYNFMKRKSGEKENGPGWVIKNLFDLQNDEKLSPTIEMITIKHTD